MFDLVNIVKTGGYLALSAIIFAESGILIGLFLPGDSLLFTAGFLSSQGYLNIWVLLPLMFISAVLGDNVGYFFGKKVGPKIFEREDSFFFKKSYLLRSKVFFEQHGGKTLILARFIPIVRTFAPILAGVGEMGYRWFMINNLIGALLWAVGLALAGYILGQSVPNADKYILPIILGIVVLSLLPPTIKILKEWYLNKNRPQ
jgi:membrane-associated protein